MNVDDQVLEGLYAVMPRAKYVRDWIKDGNTFSPQFQAVTAPDNSPESVKVVEDTMAVLNAYGHDAVAFALTRVGGLAITLQVQFEHDDVAKMAIRAFGG